MPLEQDTVKAFKQNRAATWAASKLWLLLMAIGLAGAYLSHIGNMRFGFGGWLLPLLCFFFFCISLARFLYIVRTRYVCPACGETPMIGRASFGPSSFGYSRGVDLNPSECPSCGAKLK